MNVLELMKPTLTKEISLHTSLFLSNATRLYSGIKTPSIWFSAVFIHNSNILLFFSWMLYVFYAPKIVCRAFPGEHFLK